jgi:hypothetical protein
MLVKYLLAYRQTECNYGYKHRGIFLIFVVLLAQYFGFQA